MCFINNYFKNLLFLLKKLMLHTQNAIQYILNKTVSYLKETGKIL